MLTAFVASMSRSLAPPDRSWLGFRFALSTDVGHVDVRWQLEEDIRHEPDRWPRPW
jgi:hypothetical protein